MIPWFKSGNVRKLEDGRDSIFIKTGSAFKVEDVIKPWKVYWGGCGCSDDLAVVCEAHGSPRSEYALMVVTEYADMEISVCRRCHGWGCWPGPCGGDEKGA